MLRSQQARIPQNLQIVIANQWHGRAIWRSLPVGTGFHTDGRSHALWLFEKCLFWASRNDAARIQFCSIDGALGGMAKDARAFLCIPCDHR